MHFGSNVKVSIEWARLAKIMPASIALIPGCFSDCESKGGSSPEIPFFTCIKKLVKIIGSFQSNWHVSLTVVVIVVYILTALKSDKRRECKITEDVELIIYIKGRSINAVVAEPKAQIQGPTKFFLSIAFSGP